MPILEVDLDNRNNFYLIIRKRFFKAYKVMINYTCNRLHFLEYIPS